ncbi:MAG TPA: hypothetical protein PKA95_15025 [Thermomicrobiales bacterium]|nr:hypothetical protein [Thermomicrobiales bacterium]
MRAANGPLDTVLWIGGGTDAGKTTIAALIAERHGLASYHFDRQEMRHFAQADPARQPALWQAHPDRMTAEERWLGAPPAAMARETIACWTERFWMAADDLRAMPDAGILAEGPGLFPDCVATQIDDPRQAVFLIPSEEFKRAAALARGKPGARHETSDPERATRQIFERDRLMREFVRERAAALGLRVVEVDGSLGVEEVAALVEEWFGERLAALAG